MTVLKVVSFNIRYATAPDGVYAWEHRKNHLTAYLRSEAPDLLGIQECRADGQLDDLLGSLPGYACFGMPRGGENDAAAEMAPVFYWEDRFSLVDQGMIWLSETPAVPGSLSWGAALPRTLTWVVLEGAGLRIWFGNVHLDHWSGAARERSAALVADRVKSRPAGEACILTGDFNTLRGTAAHEKLIEVLEDPFTGMREEEVGSFHGYGLLDPPLGIDWVLVDPSLRIASAKVVMHRPDGGYLSDHDPVVVQLAA